MSPRPGPERRLVALRLGEGEIAAVDKAARRQGLNRSEQIRLMLAYAEEHMPRDWNPAGQIDSKGKQK